MDEKLFELELEIISKSSFSYLLGYYEQALRKGLQSSWRKLSDMQSRKVIEALLDKIELQEQSLP